MDKAQNNDILSAFETYKKAVFATNNDLNFWHSFTKWAISEYKNTTPSPEIMYESLFATYDLNHNSFGGFLKTHKESFIIRTDELELHRQNFFNWVMNLSIIKTYNALEIFLLQTIRLTYFPTLDYVNNKKSVDLIQNEIRNYLLTNSMKYETKNNKYLIQFLKTKSTEFATFINCEMNVDLKTKWEDFFELISILRNVIAHQGMVISDDNENEIKSKAKDIFQIHFNCSKNFGGYSTLRPKEDQFSSLINLIDRFALNTVKFVSNQPNLTFLNMN